MCLRIGTWPPHRNHENCTAHNLCTTPQPCGRPAARPRFGPLRLLLMNSISLTPRFSRVYLQFARDLNHLNGFIFIPSLTRFIGLVHHQYSMESAPDPDRIPIFLSVPLLIRHSLRLRALSLRISFAAGIGKFTSASAVPFPFATITHHGPRMNQ